MFDSRLKIMEKEFAVSWNWDSKQCITAQFMGNILFKPTVHIHSTPTSLEAMGNESAPELLLFLTLPWV